jgi:predicted unusual protein kinase regulating ubiquinone biosynthesis (AarF/ABC1/UbiB family)
MPRFVMASDVLSRIDTLIQVGLRLARSAPTGRFALARIAEGLDPLWIPRPWGDEIAAELEAARVSAAQPIDARRVEKLLRDAWGAKPTDELDELDLEPVAVSPSSQVHRGVLDGTPVAVKVLRPGLASSARQDLALLDGLLAPLGAAFPALDSRAVVSELRERVMEELDLENEAAAQRRFHRALRGHPSFTVPAPFTALARDDVLVSEWVDGVPIAQAPDPDAAAARLLVFAIGAARSAGAVHADAALDDVLVLADGRLAILDFGATRAVEAERVDLSAAALEAFAEDDAAAFAGAVAKLGWLPETDGGDAIELARHALGELAGPGTARLDSAAVVAARDRLLHERPEALARLIAAGALPPLDLWPARGIAQAFGVVARVGATGDWLALARAAVRDGWDAQAG